LTHIHVIGGAFIRRLSCFSSVSLSPAEASAAKQTGRQYRNNYSHAVGHEKTSNHLAFALCFLTQRKDLITNTALMLHQSAVNAWPFACTHCPR
jgi:hypothetical protein